MADNVVVPSEVDATLRQPNVFNTGAEQSGTQRQPRNSLPISPDVGLESYEAGPRRAVDMQPPKQQPPIAPA
jgi:hypothetical protein